jgi:hypothetical protein
MNWTGKGWDWIGINARIRQARQLRKGASGRFINGLILEDLGRLDRVRESGVWRDYGEHGHQEAFR